MEMDDDKNCLLLRTTQNQIKSHPYGELEVIWEELMRQPAVHVERVLHGSRTSRNQPKTILANLPYIEWLKLSNMKHIAYIGKSSHPFGTLKQMNALQAADIAARISSPAIFEGYSALVVTKDLNGSISAMRCLGGGATDLVCQGAYSLKTPSYRFLFVLHSMTTLAEGTYFILERGEDDVGLPCLICGQKYSVIDKDGVKAMQIIK
ncbi:MAG: hypothetical protein ABFC56_05270 [Clostridiaceae bacterium]